MNAPTTSSSPTPTRHSVVSRLLEVGNKPISLRDIEAVFNYVQGIRLLPNYRTAGLTVFGWMLFLSLLVIFTGTLVGEHYTHDSFVFLNGAWKVRCGLRPHTDFYTSLGPLNYMLPAAAMLVTGPSAYALPIARLLTAVPIIYLGWHLLRHRLSASALTISLIFISAQLLRYAIPGAGFAVNSYASTYNHICNAILILIAVSAALPRLHKSAEGEFADAVMQGASVALLFFFKVSYPPLAAALLLGSFFFQPLPLIRLAGMCAGLVFVWLPMMAYLRFDHASMFRDLGLVASIRTASVSYPSLIYNNATRPEVLVLAALAAFLVTQAVPFQRAICLSGYVGLIWIVQAMSSATLTSMPGQPNHIDLPVLLGGFIVPFALSTEAPEDGSQVDNASQRIICGTSVIMLGSLFALNLISLIHAFSAAWTTVHTQAIDAPSLKKFKIIELSGGRDEGLGDRTYVEKINDGLEILRANTSASCRTDVLDFSDPFSLALRRPPSNGPAYWQSKFTFDASRYPDAEYIFRNTDAIMIPGVGDCGYDPDVLCSIYKDFLQKNFYPHAHNDSWLLLLRRPGHEARRAISAK